MPSPSGRCGWELSSSASFSPFYSLADVDSTDAAFRILNHCRRMVYSTSNAVRAAQSNRLDGAPIDRPPLVFVVYEAVEVLDFCGPFEVFSVTRLNEEKRREEPSPFNVFLIAEATSPVVATGGMKVVPDYDFDTCPQLDILIIPGGWGAIRKMNNERLVNWIGRRSRQVDTVTSVCTGALLLGKAGLLTANVPLRIGVFLIGCRSSFQKLPSIDKYISWRKKASSAPRASPPGLTCP